MVEYDSIVKVLENWIDEKRLRHSKGVSRCAMEMADHYGADKEKAELAGLVHDCAKCLTPEKSLSLCKKYGYDADEIALRNMALLHAPLGAYLARELFDIHDKAILDAIRWHTTGKKKMTLLDKIIFVADYMEEGRSFPCVEEIRNLAYIDLDKALITALELSIRNVLDRGKLLHPKTIEARNYLIMRLDTENTIIDKKSLKNQKVKMQSL